MITELGAFALVLALMLSVAQTGLSAVGGARRSVVLAVAGRGAAVAVFLAVAVPDFPGGIMPPLLLTAAACTGVWVAIQAELLEIVPARAASMAEVALQPSE